MAKVLRGGKWRTVSRGTSSSASSVPSPHIPLPNPQPHHEQEENHQDSGSILCFLEESNHLALACYYLSSNQIHISKFSAQGDYHNATLVVSQVDPCVLILPKSYSNNIKLLRAVNAPPLNHDEEHPQVIPNSPQNSLRHHPDQPQQSPRKPISSPLRTPNNHSHSQNPSNDTNLSTETHVSYLPNNDFSLTKATELCRFVNIRGMPASLAGDDRLAYLSHLLGEDDCILRAVGGLLSFVLQNGVLGTLGEQNQTIQINAILYHNYCNVMRVSVTGLRELRVFSRDAHPLGRGSMKGKEGLSLYGILKSHVKTMSAKKLLQQWLMYPSTCLQTIQNRQLIVDILRKSSNSALLLALKEALRGVKNVPAILLRFWKSISSLNDWKSLYSSLKSFIVVQDTLKIAMQQNNELLQSPLLAEARDITESDLRECVNWIDAVVDFEESTACGRMVVMHGFSDEIDEMKRSYSGLDDFLTNVGAQEHQKFSYQNETISLSFFHFTYQPQIGYLIVVPESDCGRIGVENLEKLGMSFVFSSTEDGYHFKNERCRHLDEELGDIHGAIIDLETKAFRFLTEKIISFGPILFSMSTVIRKLDCLQALACAANEYSWTKPNFVESGEGVVIEEGRHPLVECVVTSFVPNPCSLKFGDVQVITGPNFSGKSVYLSQVALQVILAQIGSFVPAKKANMSIIHNINTRVSSFESVSYAQSSFFMDACQVARMLVPCQGRSLHLIDEFGKGTTEVNGMALLAATLRSFLRLEPAAAPICICCTHFYEILRDPFIPMSNPRLSVCSMEVITRPAREAVKGGKQAVLQQIPVKQAAASVGSRASLLRSQGNAPPKEEVRKAETEYFGSAVRTYKLLSGSICHESRAFQCALECAVPKFILQRAAHVRHVVSGDGYIEGAIPCEENNSRFRICSDSVRELLSTDYRNNQGNDEV